MCVWVYLYMQACSVFFQLALQRQVFSYIPFYLELLAYSVLCNRVRQTVDLRLPAIPVCSDFEWITGIPEVLNCSPHPIQPYKYLEFLD